MEKRITTLAAIVLSAVLLCSCAPADSVREATLPSEVMAAPTMLPSSPPKAAQEITDGISGMEAMENMPAYFELYKLLNPGSYIGVSGWGPDTAGYIEAHAYGPDLPAFEVSGILPDCVVMEYGEQFDPRPSHPILREPESEVSFDDGVTLRMERSVYPVFPEYVQYTMETTSTYMYGGIAFVYKYVGGEWHCIPDNYSSTAMGTYLHAGEIETFDISTAQWLGEGLYRIERDGDHYVEFIVSADAEPLEPLPAKTQRKRSYAANFFYQLELPENCVNKLMGSVDWYMEAGSFSTDFNREESDAQIAAQFLGNDFAYNADDGTYTCGELTLCLDDGISLVSSSPDARAFREVYPYCATELIPAYYQELGIGRGSMDNNGVKVKSMLLDSKQIFSIDGAFGFYEQTYTPGFSVLHYDLKRILEYYRTTLSEEYFNEKYGGMEEVRFNGTKYHYKRYSVTAARVKMYDEYFAPATTSLENSLICGPEIYYACIDDELAALEAHRVPACITPNDDTAPVITPFEAAAVVLPELGKINRDIKLVAAEFSYAYHNSDLSVLRPTWIFTAAYETASLYDDKITVENYIHFAVDALTCELLAD